LNKEERREAIVKYFEGDELAADVLISKYLKEDENSPEDMWTRLASEIAGVEKGKKKEKWTAKFLELLTDFKFIPGGRIMYAAGRDEKVSLTNCYVIPIRETIDYENIPSGYIPIVKAYMDHQGDCEKTVKYLEDHDYYNGYYHDGADYVEKLKNHKFIKELAEEYIIPADSIEGIFSWLRESALVYRSTGGVGVDISCLRPAGAPVMNSGGVSPGACSFMDLMSRSTHTVHQKLRRGALILTLSIHHPDALDFINIKRIRGKIDFMESEGEGHNDLFKLVENANISVMITDEFMRAVENDEEYEQRFPIDSDNPQIVKKVSAKKVWNAIIKNAHEYAEPGIIFEDNIKKDDCLAYINRFHTVNPSLGKGTKVLTKKGIYSIEELEGKSFEVVNLDGKYSPAKCFLSGRSKKLYEITLKNNVKYYATKEHKWPIQLSNGIMVKVDTGELKPGLFIPDVKVDKISDGTLGNYEDGFVVGWNIGDGWSSKRENYSYSEYGFILSEVDYNNNIGDRIVKHLHKVSNSNCNFHQRKGRKGGRNWYEMSISNTQVDNYFSSFGFTGKKHGLPDIVWGESSEEFRRGLIDGLFSSDGHVGKESLKRILLTTSIERLAKDVSNLLGFYGITSEIVKRKSKNVRFPNNKKYCKTYIGYEVIISRYSCIEHFRKLFKLSVKHKQDRLENFDLTYKKRRYSFSHMKIIDIKETSLQEDVWDISVFDDTHCFKLSHCITGNCAEEPLGKFSNCNLGHMNLDRYVIVVPSDTGEKKFAFEEFSRDVKVAVRFLDNVIDYNIERHALPQLKETALNERRVGLGLTGLGDCLIKLNIKYDSEEALNFVQRVMEVFRNSAFESSVELAEEKEAFPWFEYEKWKESKFVSRWIDSSEQEVFEKLEKTGIRNAFLLTVAPVGSGSILGQVSSGIEPLFATSYTRRVRQQDGETFKEYKTYPNIIEKLFETDKDLPDYVTTAHEIDPIYRIKVQGVVQKYIDASISSTINLPKNTKIGAVSDIYINAWREGLKGVTVYREGSREGILIVTESEKRQKEKEKEEKQTRKNSHQELERPIELNGPTYKIPSGADENLYITVNPDPDDPRKPYEVFIGSYSGASPEIQTITVLLSALLKNVGDTQFVIDRLKRIESSAPVVWWHDKDAGRRHQINTVSRAVALALEKFVDARNGTQEENRKKFKDIDERHLEKCPKCRDMSYINESGCGKCISCGYEKCF